MSLPPGVHVNQANIAQTIRNPSTALLTIDSNNRFDTYVQKRNAVKGSNNFSPYDFTIRRNQALMNGFFTRIAVTEIVFPTISLPNINNLTNAINVTYKIGAAATVVTRITISPGFYNPSAIATAIKTAVIALDAGLSTFDMKYGVNNNCVFSYSTVNVANSISFAPILAGSNPAVNYNDTTRQLFDLLGFNASNQTRSPTGFGGYTNCIAFNYVDIVCSELIYNQSLKDTSSQKSVRDSLCRLYLADYDNVETVQPSDASYTPPGCAPTVIYRNFTVPKQIQWIPNQPVGGSLHFEVYDENGNLLSTYGVTPNFGQADWRMTLLASEN
jgi:hypothetical protein